MSLQGNRDYKYYLIGMYQETGDKYYLREKIRAIKDELGDVPNKADDMEALKQMIAENPYPEYVKDAFIRSFTIGISEPSKRIIENEWQKLFIRLRSEIIQCGCGRKGCLECYCSATGMARTARERLDMGTEPSLLRDKDEISSKDVYDAARQGDALAASIFEYTGTLLGRAFADFVAFSAPEAIVLFGGLARAKEYIYEPIVRSMNENLLKIWKDKVKVVFSSLKEADAAILGASALAWEL